jgi:hypothetical protein
MSLFFYKEVCLEVSFWCGIIEEKFTLTYFVYVKRKKCS